MHQGSWALITPGIAKLNFHLFHSFQHLRVSVREAEKGNSPDHFSLLTAVKTQNYKSRSNIHPGFLSSALLSHETLSTANQDLEFAFALSSCRDFFSKPVRTWY